MKYASTADELKKLDELMLPDPRFQCFGWKPESIHRELQKHELNPRTPEAVRSQFDKARNLLLYSWYVYSFAALANLAAYSALELALAIRIQSEDPVKSEKIRGLHNRMAHALKSGWWNEDQVRHFVELKAVINSDPFPGNKPPIEDAKSNLLLLKAQDSMPKLRNSMAHGAPTLHPPNFKNLSICCDLINQLYPKKF